MRLVSNTPRAEQPRNLMMLDDAEMAMQISELALETSYVEPKRPAASACAAAAPMQLNDFLTELYAAAGMIMDRAECDALANELLERHQLVLAA